MDANTLVLFGLSVCWGWYIYYLLQITVIISPKPLVTNELKCCKIKHIGHALPYKKSVTDCFCYGSMVVCTVL